MRRGNSVLFIPWAGNLHWDVIVRIPQKGVSYNPTARPGSCYCYLILKLNKRKKSVGSLGQSTLSVCNMTAQYSRKEACETERVYLSSCRDVVQDHPVRLVEIKIYVIWRKIPQE